MLTGHLTGAIGSAYLITHDLVELEIIYSDTIPASECWSGIILASITSPGLVQKASWHLSYTRFSSFVFDSTTPRSCEPSDPQDRSEDRAAMQHGVYDVRPRRTLSPDSLAHQRCLALKSTTLL